MQYKSVKGFTGWGQLGILFVFLGFGFILAGGAQFIIGMKMMPAGTSLNDDMAKEMMKAMLKPENVGYARLAQIMGTFLLLFIPAVFYSWVTNGRNKFWLGFNAHINVYQVLIGFCIIFFANIMSSPLEDISRSIVAGLPSLDKIARELEQAYQDQVLALSNLKSWPEFVMAIFIMAFFPALFEEIFFRGAVQNLFERWWKNPMLAIIVTSLLFSLVHMSIYLFFTRMALGFVLGLMYHKTKNIWVNVVAHFLNNAIAVAQLYYLSQQKQQIDINKMNPKVEWWYGLVALVVVIFLFVLLNRISVKNRVKIAMKEAVLMEEGNTHDPFANHENI